MRPISGAIGFGCNRQVGHLSPSEPPPGQLLWGSPTPEERRMYGGWAVGTVLGSRPAGRSFVHSALEAPRAGEVRR